MCYAQWKDTHKKKIKQADSVNDAGWDDVSRHNMALEDRHGPKEKSTVRKVMVPVSSIIKLWNKVFK